MNIINLLRRNFFKILPISNWNQLSKDSDLDRIQSGSIFYGLPSIELLRDYLDCHTLEGKAIMAATQYLHYFAVLFDFFMGTRLWNACQDHSFFGVF